MVTLVTRTAIIVMPQRQGKYTVVASGGAFALVSFTGERRSLEEMYALKKQTYERKEEYGILKEDNLNVCARECVCMLLTCCFSH